MSIDYMVGERTPASGKNDRLPYSFGLLNPWRPSKPAHPDPALYKAKQNDQPPLDARVRENYSTPNVQTSHLPTAREVLYRLLNL